MAKRNSTMSWRAFSALPSSALSTSLLKEAIDVWGVLSFSMMAGDINLFLLSPNNGCLELREDPPGEKAPALTSSLAAVSPRKKSIKMPAIIPLWIEYVNGTTVMVKKDGMAARRSSQSMPRQGAIIKAPMRTNGTAVATCGMDPRRGARKADTKKSTETVTAARPVRAPSIIPALLSLAMITGLVPSSAPTIVPTAALVKIEVLLGTVPFFSSPAMPIRPYWTPAKSKSATKRRTKLPTIMQGSLGLPGAHAEKSTLKAVSNLG
mmetsp:Transcript_95271/g.171989  ORF Transcript_95271/g.171989 Transcript_95271/m.171989 type:complete len:265 (+) Transcript_95271:271-1065(+)